MRPISIPKVIKSYIDASKSKDDFISSSVLLYKKLNAGVVDVSIVIPAFNEQDNIVSTLISLCNSKTSRFIEIIVVNNNSTDHTEDLVKAFGVKCVNEKTQGISNARNTGLRNAVGRFILNADADTIYPTDWIDEMVKPLTDSRVAITYGRFSLIPTGKTGRRAYFAYEYLAEFTRLINKYAKDEAVNVYGFNSGFRREQGLSVNGFDHPAGTNEDGYLALKLRAKGYGKLYCVTAINALVWTTDRRIQIDGGVVKGTLKRLRRLLKLS